MRLRMVLFLLLVILLAACSTPHKLPEAPTPIPRLEPATLPPSEAPVEQPSSSTGEAEPAASAGDGDDVAVGEEVFDGRCSVCHNLNDQQKVGPGLKGLFGKSSLPNGESFSEAALRDWIVNGGGQMVGVPLEDSELDDLLAYLREATQ